MPVFKYKAAQQDGKIIEAEKRFNTKQELIDELHRLGLIIVSIEEKIGFDFKTLGQLQIGDMPLKEKVFFSKQLSAMLGAGLPIVQALEILIDQAANASVKAKLTNVYKDIKGGLPLAGSFAKYDLIFNELQLSLIRAGEQSGNLVEVIKQISIDMQKSHQIQSKVKGALIYPVIILITAVMVIIVLVVFMIPAVETLYIDLGASADDMPAITRALVSVSDFFTNPLGLVLTLVLLITGLVSLRSFYGSKFGRRAIDKLLLRMPVFGSIISKNQVLQMTRLLGMLMESGIPIVDALKATGNALGNIHFKSALHYAAESVAKGTPISVPLAKSGIVPIMVIKMIATGEDTGSLDQILADLTKFYEDEVNELTSNLTKLMEPLMLLVVGGLVAFLALAVYLPIYSISNFV